jgi:hypothetical protein
VSRVHADLNRIGGLLKLAIREGVADRPSYYGLNVELRATVRHRVDANDGIVHALATNREAQCPNLTYVIVHPFSFRRLGMALPRLRES